MCLRSRLASWRRAQTNCYVWFLSCLPSSRPTRPWGDGRGRRLFQELADFHTAVILWEHFLPGGGGRKLNPVTGKTTHHSLPAFPGCSLAAAGTEQCWVGDTPKPPTCCRNPGSPAPIFPHLQGSAVEGSLSPACPLPRPRAVITCHSSGPGTEYCHHRHHALSSRK